MHLESQKLRLLRSKGGVEWKNLNVKERRLGFEWVNVVLNALFIFSDFLKMWNLRERKFEVEVKEYENYGEESKLNS